MSKKTPQQSKPQRTRQSSFVRRFLPYFVAAVVIFATVFYGSREKSADFNNDLNMESIATNNFSVSADQLSEFYMVANVADTMNLSTSTVINTNYDSISLMHDAGQNTIERIEKPTVIDTSNISRGVVNHTVADGETMDSIAASYGITSTQIRWSNNLKTTDLNPGQTILVPTVPGISYTVKEGDTIDSLAQKYNSNASQIISYNDLETKTDLSPGSTIILPSGELPETERPEYEVIPSTVNGKVSSNSAAARAASSSYTAQMASGNKYAYGWCTWYAWQWRTDNMPGNYVLPGNLGNAALWASRAAAAGYTVNKTPAYGAVFQTPSGYYGHVGIVKAVNPDGSVVISDMNGVAGWGRVGTKTLSKAEAQRYTYIHGK